MVDRGFLVVLLTLGLVGCDPPKAPGPTPPKPVVALVVKTLTNPYFTAMERGARRAEREWGFTLVVKSAAEEISIEQQIVLIETLTDDQVAAIVVAPGSSSELVPVLKRAQDRGICLVNVDNRLDPAVSARAGLKNVPFISVDNEEGAYLAARALVEGVSQPEEAAILGGIAEASNATLRERGAERAFAENPLVRLVDCRTAHWKIDEAHDVTLRLFRDHPQIRLLFAANDMMALGALRYLDEAGLTQVRVAGFDALDEAVKAVVAGRLVATVDQQAAVQGYLGCATAARLLAHQPVDPEVLVPVHLVTRGTPGF